MIRARACLCTRSRRVLLSVALAFAMLAYMVPAGIMTRAAWSDEPADQPVNETVNDEQEDIGGAAADDACGDTALDHQSPGSTDTSGAGEPNDEERGIIEGLASVRARLDEALVTLAADFDVFDTARNAIAKMASMRDDISGSAEDMQKRLDELERARHDALMLIKMIQDELIQSGDYGTRAIITGASTPADVELRQEMLERLLIAESGQIRKVLGDQRRLRVAIALDAASSSQARRELHVLVQPVNKAAYEVEKRCSRVRQCVRDVQLAVEGMQDACAVLVTARADMLAAAKAASRSVENAERAVGTWYDELDVRAGLSTAVSFGEGASFSLPEEEFVDMWGSAIDAFFEECSKTMGDLPLQGYGHKMAASAYRYKIDPRLCAAVSIAESSGGQNCIRACNAWGWGAADSDPYGLAAEWNSFEEAIEAWHEGMAMSTSGLAEAASVSALGAIYCSSPLWSATVIEQMRLISSFA